MNRQEAATAAQALPLGDAQAFFSGGMALLNADHAELLQPLAQSAAEMHQHDPRLWQLLGLAARTAGDSRTAVTAFAAAARMAPADGLIAHSLARAALDAGQLAAGLFERAFQLNPRDGTIILGRAAARVQEGEAERGATELIAILRRNPLWIDGHRSLSHLLGQLGHPPDRMIAEALGQHPANPDLLRLLVRTRMEARDLAGATAAAAHARSVLGNQVWIALYEGHLASEAGDLVRADNLFAQMPPSSEPAELAFLARHLIRARRPDDVSRLLENAVEHDVQHVLYPYLSLAWRMTSDPRWAWLEGDPRLVSVIDLSERVGDLEALAAHLRTMHFAKAPPLDQSVLGGTQTDGNLLLRGEPPISHLRNALMKAVEDHVRQLPPPVANHPALIEDRHPLRIAGSWSVRLEGGGFHSDHVHSMGWISSAFYVALPDPSPAPGQANAGWLSLGECRDLVPELEPVRLIEPRPGRLVLFPSMMWHGTRPFPSGERMTVAFDIATPSHSRLP